MLAKSRWIAWFGRARISSTVTTSKGHESPLARPTNLSSGIDILLNLALAEMNSDHPVDGVKHLRAYVSSLDAPAGKIATVEKLLPKAYQKIVLVETSLAPGSIVEIDQTPEQLPLFGESASLVIAPGRHVLRNPKTDYSVEVDGKAGDVLRIDMRQTKPAPAQAPAPPAPVPSTTPATTVNPQASSTGTTAARTITLVSGTALTVVAAAVGGYFLVKRNSDQNRFDSARSTVGPHGPAACVAPTLDLVQPCNDLREGSADHDRHSNAALGSFVAASALGVATIATFLLWPSAERKAATAVTFSRPAGGGAVVWMSGRF